VSCARAVRVRVQGRGVTAPEGLGHGRRESRYPVSRVHVIKESAGRQHLHKCEHKHALAHGEHWQLVTAQARRERTGNGMCSPGTGSTKGSAALRRDSTQTSLSRHMSCTRKRRGAQPLPENSGFPSPQVMQRPLSLPVLLACICRSMRLQRMMPIGSSSEFTSPQRSV
jgi:hypothetical protein